MVKSLVISFKHHKGLWNLRTRFSIQKSLLTMQERSDSSPFILHSLPGGPHWTAAPAWLKPLPQFLWHTAHSGISSCLGWAVPFFLPTWIPSRRQCVFALLSLNLSPFGSFVLPDWIISKLMAFKSAFTAQTSAAQIWKSLGWPATTDKFSPCLPHCHSLAPTLKLPASFLTTLYRLLQKQTWLWYPFNWELEASVWLFFSVCLPACIGSVKKTKFGHVISLKALLQFSLLEDTARKQSYAASATSNTDPRVTERGLRVAEPTRPCKSKSLSVSSQNPTQNKKSK